MYLSSQFQNNDENQPIVPFSITPSELTDPKQGSMAYQIYSRVSAEKRGSFFTSIPPQDEQNLASMTASQGRLQVLEEQKQEYEKPLLQLETDQESIESDDASILQEVQHLQHPSSQRPVIIEKAPTQTIHSAIKKVPQILSPYVLPSQEARYNRKTEEDQKIEQFVEVDRETYTGPIKVTDHREDLKDASPKIHYPHIGGTQFSPKIKVDLSSVQSSSDEYQGLQSEQNPEFMQMRSVSVQDQVFNKEHISPEIKQAQQKIISNVQLSLRQKSEWFVEMQRILIEAGYSFNLMNQEHGFSHIILRDALSVVIRDAKKAAQEIKVGQSQKQKLDSDNKQKSAILDSQTRSLQYSEKVKNKAIKKYRNTKQKYKDLKLSMKPALAELESTKFQLSQLVKILKQQQGRIQELEKDMQEKSLENEDLNNHLARTKNVHSMQQDVELFKLQKEFQQAIPASLQSRITDYLAYRREDCLDEIKAAQSKVECLSRQNQMLYHKNEELLNRQISLVQNVEKLEQVMKQATEERQKYKYLLGQKEEELERIERESIGLQHKLSDLQIELEHLQKNESQRETLKRENMVSLYEMSNEECRKLVSQICAVIGVRTPQIIVSQISEREKKLKQIGLIELVFRKIGDRLENRKGFTSVQLLDGATLRREEIFRIEARILEELEHSRRLSS